LTGADHVWLDFSAIEPERIRNRFPNIAETCRQYGLEILRDQIPVAPAAHYMMGGVATDLFGRSSLPGLFACGEVACTGVHGANRLASNSLLEDLVFAHRIAGHLAEDRPAMPKPETLVPAPIPGAPESDPGAGIADLQRTMSAHAGIGRTGAGLTEALTHLRSQPLAPVILEAEPKRHEWANMLLVANLILEAAFLRTESRGCHFRADYPLPDESWKMRLYFSRAEREQQEAGKP